MEKEIVNQVQEVQRVPYTINPRRNTPRCILVKLTKTKEKATSNTHKGNPICLITDLSALSLQARREWQHIFKVLQGENLQPRLLYLTRISFITDGEIKSFSDKQKSREFSTTKPALKQMLKGLI